MAKSRKDRSEAKKFAEGMRAAGRLAWQLLNEVEKFVTPGITTLDIDRLVARLTKEAGALSAPFGYHGFPAHCCTSVNEVVCHGIPSDRKLVDGDIVNVDVTPKLRGFHGDASRMFCVGNVRDEAKNLIQVTQECLTLGIAACYPGCSIAAVGRAIEPHARANGYSVVWEYTGHGTGKTFHKDPPIPHMILDDEEEDKQEKLLLYSAKFGHSLPTIEIGTAFTVEPMINMGRREVLMPADDGWTVATADKSLSAQWEHTMLMTHEGPEILTNGPMEVSSQ